MHCVQVYAIYGGDDSSYLPDLPVLESIFPNFGSTVVPGGRHPVYLDDPELFNSLLIELAQNITSTSLSSDASDTGTSTQGVAPESGDSPIEEPAGDTQLMAPPTSDEPIGVAGLTAVVVGLTCVGLAVAFKIL